MRTPLLLLCDNNRFESSMARRLLGSEPEVAVRLQPAIVMHNPIKRLALPDYQKAVTSRQSDFGTTKPAVGRKRLSRSLPVGVAPSLFAA